MPVFIHATCPCGRTVRAKVEQAGTIVRCWGCRGEVLIPIGRARGRLARSYAEAVAEAFHGESLLIVLVGALLVTAAFAVPVAGPSLGFACLALAGWRYQKLIRDSGLVIGRGEPLPDGPADDSRPRPVLFRLALAALGAASLAAPFLARNAGQLLPVRYPLGGSRALMLVLALGWVVVPLILLLFHARDRLGNLPPTATLAALFRAPGPALLALLLAPLGFLAIEAALAFLSFEQDFLILLVSDLFPPPIHDFYAKGPNLIYRYENFRAVRYYVDDRSILPVYLAGLRNGYTLLGTIPVSLGFGTRVRTDPTFFFSSYGSYFAYRLISTYFAITALGFLLAVQARWLGIVASVGAQRTVFRPATASARATPPTPAPSPPPADLPPAPAHLSLEDAQALTHHESFHAARHAFPVPEFRPPPPPPSPDAPHPTALQQTHASMNGAHAVEAPVFPPVTLTTSPLPSILIIDDERAFSEAIGRIFAGRGFAVVVADNAADGLRHARQARPDLIILDVLLPDRNGLDLCRELRTADATRNTPILIASYKTSAEDEVAGLTAGADDYIAKPYVVDVLIARVQKHLRTRRI